jgi:thiosulfate/3-mercaptopyruvate sulfurtransferase
VKDTRSSLPHMMPVQADFAQAVGAMGIGDGMTIVVYDGMGLFSAPRVRWMFRAFGANDVMILSGGFPKWQSEGRPVASGAEQPRRPAAFTARFDASAVADTDDVKKALAKGSAQVVDARPANRFRGEAPEPRPGLPSGHMPGAHNLPFTELVEDGVMKDAGALRAAFASAGVDVSRPVITSCGSGVSAAILSTALEVMGQPALALYDGSWAEWGSRGDCAIASVGEAETVRR